MVDGSCLDSDAHHFVLRSHAAMHAQDRYPRHHVVLSAGIRLSKLQSIAEQRWFRARVRVDTHALVQIASPCWQELARAMSVGYRL